MELGIVILGIIVIVDLIIVIAVLNWGSKHDSHSEIRSAESSRAVQLLLERHEKAQKKLAALQAEEAPQATEDTPEKISKKAGKASPLGDEEEKARRREAALARKDARQQGN